MTLITFFGAASCVPLNDLNEYRQPTTETGALPPAAGDPEMQEGTAGDPPAAAGSAGASGEGSPVPSGPLSGVAGASGASGDGQLGSDPTPTDPEALERTDAGAAQADAAPQGPCLAEERLAPNGRCFFAQATLATWAASRDACLTRGQGWDLASIRSPADAEFVGSLITAEAWIGASDADNEGTWIWINDAQPFWLGGADGVPADDAYTNWNATEPNGATTTNCARALPPGATGASNDDAPWADLDCAQLRSALCEGPR